MSKAFKDIEKLSFQELQSKLNELELELLKLRAQSVSGAPPKNVAQLKNTKRIMSRIKMLMVRKSLELRR